MDQTLLGSSPTAVTSQLRLVLPSSLTSSDGLPPRRHASARLQVAGMKRRSRADADVNAAAAAGNHHPRGGTAGDVIEPDVSAIVPHDRVGAVGWGNARTTQWNTTIWSWVSSGRPHVTRCVCLDLSLSLLCLFFRVSVSVCVCLCLSMCVQVCVCVCVCVCV